MELFYHLVWSSFGCAAFCSISIIWLHLVVNFVYRYLAYAFSRFSLNFDHPRSLPLSFFMRYPHSFNAFDIPSFSSEQRHQLQMIYIEIRRNRWIAEGVAHGKFCLWIILISSSYSLYFRFRSQRANYAIRYRLLFIVTDWIYCAIRYGYFER